MKNKSIGAYMNLVAAGLVLAALAVYVINGAANLTVTACAALSLVCGLAYVFVNHPVVDVCNLASVVLVTVALCQYAVDSIANFLDYFNGITMFQSGGSIESIVLTMVLMGVSLLVFLVSCFLKREKTNR